jgi:hypothetical protein
MNGTLVKLKHLRVKQFATAYVIHTGAWSSRGKFWGDVYGSNSHFEINRVLTPILKFQI